ncbi:MAG TPA: M4 family peptidase, partial [Pilimelia sp.]|nr:M4 family peptidase [Pilimelia sp.]
APAGRRTACLTGPAGANFDLYLQSRTDRGWATVARAAGPGGTERLTFTGPAGVDRDRVVSERGSGAYALTF